MIKIDINSIRSRLLFWFLLLTIIPLTTVMLITYTQQAKNIEKRTFDKLTAIRDLKVNRLNAWLTERESDLRTMATNKELTDLEYIIKDESINTTDNHILKEVNEIIHRYQKNYTSYHDIFIINPHNARIISTTNDSLLGKDVKSKDYFKNPLKTGKLSFSDVYYSEFLSHNTITYSIPIFCTQHNGEHIIGILVAYLDLDSTLYKLLLNRVGLGKTGETLIVNKDVLALNELRWHKDAPLNLQISAEPAVKAASGQTGIIITNDYRNKKVLAAYDHIDKTGWGFVCKQDMHELNAPIRVMIRKYLIIFSIYLLVIIIVAIIISSSISRPIIEINKITQQISKGDLRARSSSKSKGELGSLSRQINEMAEMTESRIKIQEGVNLITEAMIGKSSMNEFADSLIYQLKDICKADLISFGIHSYSANDYENIATIGFTKELLSLLEAKDLKDNFNKLISKKEIQRLSIPPNTIHSRVKDVFGDIPYEITFIPIVTDDVIVAVITILNKNKFEKYALEILNQSWTNINTAYSNLLSGERTRILAEQLTIMNRQLELKTEELQEQAEELQAQAEELQEQSEELQNQTEELQHTSEELQEQNIELEAQRKQVEEANKLKSEFLSNMSHELRTPLNSIMALSRVLIMQAKNKLNDEENNYLEIVERNGKKLLNLINDILDLSKIEAGKMEISPEFISLSSLLKMTAENLQSIAEEKALALSLNIPADLPFIETDESKLYHILTNIIGNAVKFTEDGSVDISVRQESKSLVVEVKDSGIGISEEMLPYIFDEFRQVDGSTSRRFEGTGLGLAIAKKMSKVLGCEISVESKLGEGTVFTITIPIKWSEDIYIVDENNHKKKTSKAKPYDSLLSKEKDIDEENKIAESHILIIDDNDDVITQLKAVLKEEGYIINVARGGQEALDYFKHSIPHGIILDLMMPEIDGFEVLEDIRTTEKTKNIPVLILTAKDLTKDELAKLSSNNIQQLIHKGDVDIDKLLNKIRLMLNIEPKLGTRNFYTERSRSAELETRNSESVTRNFYTEQSRSAKPETNLPNILIVEDNPDNMTTLKAILKGKYNIYEAVDGEQGLKIAQSQQPDLILLDMSLPEMEGEKVIQILKGNDKTKDIAVIAVTAQAMLGDKEKFLEAGCDGYIPKPIEQDELFGEIGRLLNGH
ncbi:MAG: response regulator [Saprospiraceae bacterium]|nr:response regulator [Saprospiraceae bacterium]